MHIKADKHVRLQAVQQESDMRSDLFSKDGQASRSASVALGARLAAGGGAALTISSSSGTAGLTSPMRTRAES